MSETVTPLPKKPSPVTSETLTAGMFTGEEPIFFTAADFLYPTETSRIKLELAISQSESNSPTNQ